MGWQPIETAPRDGTPFIGYADNWQCVLIYDRGNRVFLTDDARGFSYPTHWMPLPAPPAP